MTFTKESGLVKIWVQLVQKGTYTRDQVPAMYNLREVVCEILDAADETAA